MRNALKALAFVTAAILVACGGLRGTSPSVMPPLAPVQAPIPVQTESFVPPRHVTVIVMENYSYEQIVGSPSAPYINGTLIPHSTLMTNSHGVTHPSEPNYLAMFSGSTHGLTSDACPVNYTTATLSSALRAKGHTFTLYAESMPSTNYTGCQYGNYFRKHNPVPSFPMVANEAIPLSTYLNLAANVTYIVPNECNDMHSCPIQTGDNWLKARIPAIEAYDKANNGILIVTFDEGDFNPSANHIFTAIDGPGIPAGLKLSRYITHYDMLHAIETNFGTALLGSSASSTFTFGSL